MESITGIVERITYRNEENGFSVLKVKAKEKKDVITVICEIAAITEGETILITGKWHNDPKYGLQIRAETAVPVMPNTIHGLQRYLGSGLIKNVGPHFAEKIVKEFGLDSIDILDNNPEKLRSIRGIGEERIKLIARSWQENKSIRDIMIFLDSHKISSGAASKIFRHYGHNAINILQNDPYSLAYDIKGIGFLSADKIALNMGMERESPKRARAALHYILKEATSSGHCALPASILIQKIEKELSIPINVLEQVLSEDLLSSKLIEVEEQAIKDNSTATLESIQKTLHLNDNLIFLPQYIRYEMYVAEKILELSKHSPPQWCGINVPHALEWLTQKYGINLSSSQQEATHIALSNKVSVITGGPGTGKTTLINAILKILTEYMVLNAEGIKLAIKLAAPTGRAAKRLSESTRRFATTIHRMLEFDPVTFGFKYNAENPLRCDLLILDESSMIDVHLMLLVLKALKSTTSLILVGDIDQLPSVGPGQILSDIINSNAVPVVRLNKIFRQAANSRIITSAHSINNGFMPDLTNDVGSDLLYYDISDTKNCSVIEIVERILQVDLPKLLFQNKNIKNPENFSVIKDVQVLSPMQKGNAGIQMLNLCLQKLLNSQYKCGNYVEKFGQSYCIGDKVIQMENNYDKSVFNGDIGFIEGIDVEKRTLSINFDDRILEYEFEELEQLSLAYAITIHKSQGSEYPVVIIPIVTQHFIMLNANLLYTAITRGRNMVILIGEKKAIAIAVQNKKNTVRHTRLRAWLNNERQLSI